MTRSCRKTWTSIAARCLSKGVPVPEMGQRIFDLILRVASGEQSKSEEPRLRRQRVHALGNRRDDVISGSSMLTPQATRCPATAPPGTLVGRACGARQSRRPHAWCWSRRTGSDDLTARYPTLSALLQRAQSDRGGAPSRRRPSASAAWTKRRSPTRPSDHRAPDKPYLLAPRRPAGAEGLRRHLRALPCWSG